MKNFLRCLLITMLISSWTNQVLSAIWYPAKKIKGFPEATTFIQTKITIPALFPTIVPTKKQSGYFAYVELPAKNIFYILYIDHSAECKGAHYCNAGFIMAQKGHVSKTPTTQPISLAHQITGYYTPGYAMADYHPPQLQWIYQGVLYTLAWDTSRATLIQMANSALVPPASNR